MFGEGCRVLVGNLQAKPAGLPEVSAQLLRSPSLALAVVVVLINSGSMEFVDDRAKVIVGHGKGKMTASIGRLGNLAKLVDLVKNYTLIRGNSDHGHTVSLLDYAKIQDTFVKIDTGIQIRRVEVQMMEPRLVDSFGLGDFQKVSLGVLENQSFVPTTAQSLFALNVFYEETRAAEFFHHRSKLTFRDDKRMARIRSRAVAFGQGGFSLGEQSDMILAQFHEYAVHVRAVEPLQGSCPENLRVKLLGPVRIHHCQDKVIQVPNIAFGLYFSSHFTALPFLLFYRTQKLSNKALTTNLPFFTLAPASGERVGGGGFPIPPPHRETRPSFPWESK